MADDKQAQDNTKSTAANKSQEKNMAQKSKANSKAQEDTKLNKQQGTKPVQNGGKVPLAEDTRDPKEQSSEERLSAAREQAVNNHAREHANDSES